METRRGLNKDGKYDFGKNLDLLRTNSSGGEIEVDDNGGEMEIQFNEI